MFGGQEFERKQLIDLIQEGAGLSYGIVVPGDNVGDGIPMVRPSDFKNGRLNLENVKSGKEKQLAYSIEYRRYRKAMKEEFFLEAVAIGYAIIEDRLVAFLHHAGVVSRNVGNLKVNKRVYPYFRILLNKNDRDCIKVKDISVKTLIIRQLLNMSETQALEIDKSIQGMSQKKGVARPGYMVDLYKQLQVIDPKKTIEILDGIDSWRKDRNELIHALLSKKPEVADEAKKRCAEEAYNFTREIDNSLVRPFKRRNRIRKKYNIQ